MSGGAEAAPRLEGLGAGAEARFGAEAGDAAELFPGAEGLDEVAGFFNGGEAVVGAFGGVATGLGDGVYAAGCVEDEADAGEVTVIELEHEVLARFAFAPEEFHGWTTLRGGMETGETTQLDAPG